MTNLLKKMIVKAHEKAFRRGYQQGFLAARGEMDGGQEGGPSQATNAEVYAWRFESPLSRAVAPPRHFDVKSSALERLGMEAIDLVQAFEERVGVAR